MKYVHYIILLALLNLNYECINVKSGGLNEAKVASSKIAQRLPRDCPENV